MSINIENKLQVIPGNNGGYVLVPGCEPTSELTSTTLWNQIRAQGLCPCSIVPLDTALEAIPGSTVQLICNIGYSSGRRLFVLPDFKQYGCDPCIDTPDWYAVLRTLCEEFEEDFDPLCDDFGLGECSPMTFGGGMAEQAGYRDNFPISPTDDRVGF